jgi:hypothetical protein
MMGHFFAIGLEPLLAPIFRTRLIRDEGPEQPARKPEFQQKRLCSMARTTDAAATAARRS